MRPTPTAVVQSFSLAFRLKPIRSIKSLLTLGLNRPRLNFGSSSRKKDNPVTTSALECEESRCSLSFEGETESKIRDSLLVVVQRRTRVIRSAGCRNQYDQ